MSRRIIQDLELVFLMEPLHVHGLCRRGARLMALTRGTSCTASDFQGVITVGTVPASCSRILSNLVDRGGSDALNRYSEILTTVSIAHFHLLCFPSASIVRSSDLVDCESRHKQAREYRHKRSMDRSRFSRWCCINGEHGLCDCSRTC